MSSKVYYFLTPNSVKLFWNMIFKYVQFIGCIIKIVLMYQIVFLEWSENAAVLGLLTFSFSICVSKRFLSILKYLGISRILKSIVPSTSIISSPGRVCQKCKFWSHTPDILNQKLLVEAQHLNWSTTVAWCFPHSCFLW